MDVSSQSSNLYSSVKLSSLSFVGVPKKGAKLSTRAKQKLRFHPHVPFCWTSSTCGQGQVLVVEFEKGEHVHGFRMLVVWGVAETTVFTMSIYWILIKLQYIISFFLTYRKPEGQVWVIQRLYIWTY